MASRLTREEFGARFEAVSPALWCVALSILRNPDRAADAVQDAAAVALGKLGEFDPATSFGAWMSQIVRFVSLNAARRHATDQARSRTPAPGSPDQARPAPLPGEPFDDELRAALDTLSDTARACLLLRTVLGMSYAEIAAALAIPEGTAMSHVHRARAALRDRLRTTGERTRP